MDLTKVANYLTGKATEMRQEADRIEAVANDLITLTPGVCSNDVEAWAKTHSGRVDVVAAPTMPKKRVLSVAAKKRIATAQRARWAKWRKTHSN